MVHHVDGRNAAALSDYDETIKRDPNHWAAHYNSGLIHLGMGKLDDAIKLFGVAIRIDPKNPKALYQRGLAFAETMSWRPAIADFEAVLRLDPKHADAMSDLAWRLSITSVKELRDPKRAFELATKACELSRKKNSKHLETLALAYAVSGDFDAAVEWQELAIKSGAKDEGSKLRLELYRDGKTPMEK